VWTVLAEVGTKVGLTYKSIDCPRCWVIDSEGVIRWANEDRMDPPDTILNGAIGVARELIKN
jgi:hypothetical protein